VGEVKNGLKKFMDKTHIIIGNQLIYNGDISFFREIIAPELTFDNPKFIEATKAGRSTYGLLPVIKNFKVLSDKSILIPKGYKDRLAELFSIHNVEYTYEDQRVLIPLDKTLEHDIKLRPYQRKALATIGRFTEGLLIAPAGSGKTVMGISLTIMSGQKTLWLTHTNNLATQYRSRFEQFISNLQKEDVGFIGGGKVVIGNITTVGLIQTLVRRPALLEELSEQFGIVIVDECHHTPATTFTKVATTLKANYLFGLTATPYRRDGLENIMYQNIGPIRYIVNREDVHATSGVIIPTVKPIYLYTNNIDETNYQTILTSLIDNHQRNQIIINNILKDYHSGNIIIVVTDRRRHAEILFDLLKDKANFGIATGSYKKEHCEQAVEDLEQNKIRGLVCTSQLLGEGFDHPPLNRLHITLPFRNIAKCEQLVGRIQRPAEGKTDACIYDYVDVTSGLLKHQFKNPGNKGCRYNVYKNLGCHIK